MKSISEYINESITYDKFDQYFNVSDNYHKPIDLYTAKRDLNYSFPSKSPIGSIHKIEGQDAIVICPDGKDSIYDKLKKLKIDDDALIYVKMTYQKKEALWPVYKMGEDGDSNMMVSVADSIEVSKVSKETY